MTDPILLFKPIFEDTAEEITRELIQRKEKDVEIWMNTPGGSVSAGWSILAAINETKKNVSINVMGNADSFGFFMLLFSNHNKAFDTSSFMIHRAASFWEDLMTDDELLIIEERNKVIREKVEARINESKFIEITGKSFDDIFSMDDRLDVTLNADQAKEIGLIDEVVTLDVRKKRELREIESRYYRDIAALNINNSNSNSKKMSKFKDLIFGEKEPVMLANVDGKNVVYSKLEIGAVVKATGKGEQDPVSGTFEADEKIITIVNNEITAVKEVDNKAREIEALKAEIEKIKAEALTESDVAEVMVVLKNELDEVKQVLAKARLSVSNPELPEGEFSDKPVEAVNAKQKAYRIQKEIEAKAAEKQKNRVSNLKNI